MKFEEAYWEKQGKVLSIDEITQCFMRNKSFYMNEVKNYLRCPECKKPNLAYNNAASPYLSVYPNSTHADNCSLKQEEMSAKQAKNFIKNPKNINLIIRQLESVFITLFSLKTTSSTTISKATASKATLTSLKNVHTPVVNKRISRKRIDLKFDYYDFNCFKFFYGTVYLRWESDTRIIDGKAEEWHKILLFKYKERSMVCRLTISPKVYSYLPIQYKMLDKTFCKIAFLAEFHDKGKDYQSTSLMNSSYIMMEESV